MFGFVHIHKHEIGLVFRHGDFVGVRGPGLYTAFGRRIDVFDTLVTKFEHKLLDVLVRDESLRQRLVVVELTDSQRAFVWKDGRLAYLVGAGRHAFWSAPAAISVETFDVAVDFRLRHARLDAILAHADACKWLDGVSVENHERVLVFRNGELIETVGPGRHVFWKHAGRITWKAVDLREQTLDVAGQEIMTADRVTLRVNLVVTWQVVDAVRAVTAVSDAGQALYREAQLALREAVGGRSLDALLADKQTVGDEVRQAVASRAAELGAKVASIGLRDIILPGEMKAILNQVIEAQKRAEANLIKRREETAAARSQANTAKLFAENPALARMKELEVLQEVLSNAKATFIMGREDLVGQLKTIVAGKEST